jgi:hypothetical protein
MSELIHLRDIGSGRVANVDVEFIVSIAFSGEPLARPVITLKNGEVYRTNDPPEYLTSRVNNELARRRFDGR